MFDAPDVVGHNDLTVENALFVPAGDDPQGPHRLVRVIDFDLAAPTTRLLDVATTLLYWAPVAPPEARPTILRDLDAPRRARVLTEAYGFDRSERLALLDVLAQRFARSWYAMRHAAQVRGGAGSACGTTAWGPHPRQRGVVRRAARGFRARAGLTAARRAGGHDPLVPARRRAPRADRRDRAGHLSHPDGAHACPAD